jgi:hypothetical protein
VCVVGSENVTVGGSGVGSCRLKGSQSGSRAGAL